MNNKYSIIIPIYNSEKYLRNCIDSILKQTYCDFELILINDGSKDSSGSICDYYKSKDQRIKVYHIENQGVSHARNYGLSLASGEYICFVDSDDTVEEKWLEYFNEANAADMIIQGCTIIDKDNVYKKTIHIPKTYTEEEKRFQIISNLGTYLNNPWSKCYANSIIKKNNLRFLEGCSLNEDLIFVLSFLNQSKTLSTINKEGYNYIIANSHLTKKFYPPLDLLKWKIYVQQELLTLCKNQKETNLYKIITNNEFSIFSWYLIQFFHRTKYMERIEIYKFFKSFYKYLDVKKLEKNRYIFFLIPVSFKLLDFSISILNKLYQIRYYVRNKLHIYQS